MQEYIVQELSEVHSGVLLERMRKAIKLGKKHVTQCTVSFSSHTHMHRQTHTPARTHTHTALFAEGVHM